MKPHAQPSAATLAGIFLISAAILLYQVGLTRLFTVILWHQVAAMAVAIAFLGFGASGSLLTVLPRWARSRQIVPGYALAFALTSLAGYAVAQVIPFDPAQMAWNPWHGWRLGVLALVLAIPFLFGGATIAVILGHYPRHAGRLYFADLLGAASGALTVLAAFALGGTGPVFIAMLLGGLAAGFLAPRAARGLRFTAMLVIATAVLGALVPVERLQPRVSPYAELALSLRHPQARHTFSEWNVLGRVDVVDSPHIRDAPGLSLTQLAPVPPQAGLTVDGGGLNGILLKKTDVAFLDLLPSAAPYAVATPQRVLVIEPGGGLEVWNALSHGAQTVIAVQSNPLVVEAVNTRAGAASPYRHPRVQVVTESARTALARSGSFDIIVLAGARGRPVSSGIEPVQQEFNLTVEAFSGYLEHLAPGGVLAVTRYLIPPPRTELRLTAIAQQAVKRRGAARPADHLALLRSWGAFTLVASPTPLSPEQVAALRRFSEKRGFDLVSLPGLARADWNRHNRLSTPVYEQAAAELLEDPGGFTDRYRYDLTPPTDARPYFSHVLRWDKVGEVLKEMRGDVAFILEAGYLLPVFLLQALVLALIAIVLPLLVKRRAAPRCGRYLIYFALLGLGYMAIEMALLMPVALLLGRPLYSFVVILAALLFGSGLGSLSVERLVSLAGGERRLVSRVIPVIVLGTVALAWLTIPLVGHTLGWHFAARLGLALLLVVPLGFFLGMPFPVGIRMLGEHDPAAIPWAWAANGCASVVGVLSAPLLALAWGYPGVMVTAAALYCLAWLVLARPSRSG